MSFQDRDYTRENSYTDAAGGWGFYISPVVKGLIAANIAVFVLQIFAVRPMTEADARAQWNEMAERTRHAYRGRSKTDSESKKTKSESETKSKDAEASDPDSEPPEGWLDMELEDAPKICVVHEW